MDESAQAAEGTGGDGDKARDLSAVGGELAVDGVAAGASGEDEDGGHGRRLAQGPGIRKGPIADRRAGFSIRERCPGGPMNHRGFRGVPV